MKIEDSFRVDVPVDEAWKVLLDLERIAPCLPGAQLTEVEGDEYRGTVKIKVGPITAQYKGVAKIEEADEANHKVVLQAEGRDTRGQGNASATVTATLVGRGRRAPRSTSTPTSTSPARSRSSGAGSWPTCRASCSASSPTTSRSDVLQRHAVRRRRAHRAVACDRTARGARRADCASTGADGVRGRSTRTEAEPIDLMDAAGGSVGKRVVPIVAGLVVVVALRSILKRRKRKKQQRPRRPRADPSRIEPVFGPDPRPASPRSVARASTPACRAAGTASCAVTAGGSRPSPTA